MNEALHPAQIEAVEKLGRLRVGALYCERQDGKLRTVAQIVRRRLESGRADSVIWLCMRRRFDRLKEGVAAYLGDMKGRVILESLEKLSFSLETFLLLLGRARREKVMLVIDNGLLIKNPHAIRTQRVLEISRECAYRLLVGDVPVTKNAADMFSQWYALDWRILGYQSYWSFCLNHADMGCDRKNVEYLVRRIEPYCVQLRREDVQPVGRRKEYVWQFRLPENAMQEYKRVASEYMLRAILSPGGVYRMLQACQHAASGRRIVCDYPLQVRDMFSDPGDDPRLMSLLEILAHYESERVLIICRYSCECRRVRDVAAMFYGENRVRLYRGNGKVDADARLTVMSCYADEREGSRLRADVIIYYTSDWNWRKRQEKEKQCQAALTEGNLTVISLVAVNTIDERIMRCIWHKDNLVWQMQRELTQRRRTSAAEEKNAQGI